MAGDGLVFIDDHVTLACSPAEALACLDGPDAIAAWFGAQRSGARTTIGSSLGELTVVRDQQRWAPEEGLLVVDATVGSLRLHAYLTVRGVIRVDAARRPRPGSEVWAHVELGPAAHAERAAPIIADVVRRGLHHLRLELDTASDR